MRKVLVCSALLIVVTTGGCGGPDSSGASDPPTTTSTASTASTTGAPPVQTTSPATSTGDPTSTSTTPTTDAGGPTMRLSHIEVHLPTGYKIFAPGEADSDAFGPPQDTEVYISEDPAFGETLEQERALIAKNTAKGLTRQPDLTVDGIKGFVYSGISGTNHRWYFGTVTHDQALSVKIDCPTAKGFEALATTIAASIVLK